MYAQRRISIDEGHYDFAMTELLGYTSRTKCFFFFFVCVCCSYQTPFLSPTTRMICLSVADLFTHKKLRSWWHSTEISSRHISLDYILNCWSSAYHQLQQRGTLSVQFQQMPRMIKRLNSNKYWLIIISLAIKFIFFFGAGNLYSDDICAFFVFCASLHNF